MPRDLARNSPLLMASIDRLCFAELFREAEDASSLSNPAKQATDNVKRSDARMNIVP